MMRLRKLSTVCGVLVASCALALAGCSNAGSSSDAGAKDSSTGVKLVDINTQSRDKLKQGGKLRIAITQLPTNWNIQSADGNLTDNTTIFSWTGAVTFLSDEKGNVKPRKEFITGTDVEDATDTTPQKVTFHINPKAKWNNGRAIDWEDFKSLWLATNGENESFTPATTDGSDQVANVEQGNTPQDVVVTFKNAYPDWMGIFSQLYPRELTADPQMFNTGLTEPNNDFLAGPYIFKNIDKSQRVATIVPNPKWWGNKPLLDEVSFRELKDSASAQAFANNEIDTIVVRNADAYTQAKNRSDGQIREAGSLSWRHVTFNSNAKNLGDVKVRQAIERGINRQAIAKSDLAGLPAANMEKATTSGNHFFMPGQTGYQDNGKPWSYDPKAAEKLLDEAGWKLPNGKTVREKDGQPLEIDYALIKDVPVSENEGKLIQSDLGKIGIKVNMVTKSPDDFPTYVDDGEFGITTFSWVGTSYPLQNIGQIYGSGSQQNYARIDNPKIDELRTQSDMEMDKKKRAEIGNQVDQLIWEEGHTLPLYRAISYVAVPKNVANYGAWGMQDVVAENVGYTK